MKVLVLGAGGMIGHIMYAKLKKTCDVYGCLRRSIADYNQFKIFDPNKIFDGVDVNDFKNVETILNQLKPDVILNCIGITLRKKEINDLMACIDINSLFPHKLKAWVQNNGAHLIHFSTDCVFNGKNDFYNELSSPSANDTYGKTKYLGEVIGEHCLTIRGSMIGRELYGKSELLEWALSQSGKTILGYKNVSYSGVTTSTMADLIEKIILSGTLLTGLWHVSSMPISKFDLLVKINNAFNLKMKINEESDHCSKKNLNSDKIKKQLGFVCPSWDEMITQLVTEKY